MKRLILALLTGAALAASSPAYAAVKTIVLVHGAFADGSGWKPVADILQSQAYPKLIHYNKLPKGGHFAAWEQPEFFTAEMRAAFRSLRKPT
jgi:pimeloyl-ACP methyl ester carboxylesterase